MPYIKEDRRALVKKSLNEILEQYKKMGKDLRSSDLTYAITKLVVRYVRVKGLNYEYLADVDKILVTTMFEFHKRVTDPYETKKQKDNDPSEDIFGELLELLK